MEIGKEQRGNRTFFRSAIHYIDVLATPVYEGLDFQNKRTVLERLYEAHHADNPRLLNAAYTRLEKKLTRKAA